MSFALEMFAVWLGCLVLTILLFSKAPFSKTKKRCKSVQGVPLPPFLSSGTGNVDSAFLVFVSPPDIAEDLIHWPSDNVIEIGSNCPTNESNFLKKHSCDDNKEAMFLYRAARKLKQFLKMNISEDFNLHLLIVSEGTLKLLNCTGKVKERKAPSQGEGQPIKNLEENKLLKEQKKWNDLCFLRRLLEKMKTCWNKILRGAKDP